MIWTVSVINGARRDTVSLFLCLCRIAICHQVLDTYGEAADSSSNSQVSPGQCHYLGVLLLKGLGLLLMGQLEKVMRLVYSKELTKY